MSECIIEKKAIAENIEELSSLSDLALQKLNIPENSRQELMMALDEAITNIVIHGYSLKEGDIRIVIGRKNEYVTVELVDSGRKFDPTTYPEPDLNVPIEERKVGGMGVPLIRKFTDGIEYHSSNGINHFILTKKIGVANG